MTRHALLFAALALLSACGDKDDSGAACAPGCDGTVLTTCVDGEEVVTDCAGDDQICHDMGEESHCMDEGAMDM